MFDRKRLVLGRIRCVVAIILVAAPRPAVSQAPIGLDRATACATCEVVFQVLDTLGSALDPASPGPSAEAVLLASGELAVSSPPIGAGIAVYSPEGDFSGKLGRAGEGPGEFLSPPLLRRGPANTIVALDQRNGRVSFFDASRNHVKSVQLQQMRAMDFAVDGVDALVVSGISALTPDAGVIHRIDAASGAVVASFGPTMSRSLPPSEVMRRVAVSTDGVVWSAAVTGGMIEKWSSDGELRATFRLEDDAIHRPLGQRIDFERERPPGRVMDIIVDGDERVWVYYLVADPSFEVGPQAAGLTPEQIYDTRVVVFRGQTGRVLAHGQFEGLVRPLTPRLAYSLVDLPSGDRRIVTGTVSF